MKRAVRSILGEENYLLLRNFLKHAKRRLGPSAPGTYDGLPPMGGIPKKYGDRGHHTFFGYYDLSPFDAQERRLLAGRVPKQADPRRDPMEIGYYDLSRPSAPFTRVGITPAWCWQQGCRLQWYRDGREGLILYNSVAGNAYACLLQNASSGEILQTYSSPLYAVDREGRWGLSLNFSRLQRLRPGYGYPVIADPTVGRPSPEDDGISRVDLKSGLSELIIPTAAIARWEAHASMEGAEHYINHLYFNPSGTRFMFFHLWVKNGKRHSRLVTSDLTGGARCLLVNQGTVSHYAWLSDSSLVLFIYRPDTGNRYYRFEDGNPRGEIIAGDLLREDGHPSPSPDGRLLLTDTYPDAARNQHLLIYRRDTGQLYRLGAFGSPLRYFGEKRCDLHPRWSPQGNFIAFDSAHEGYRAVYTVELPKGLKN